MTSGVPYGTLAQQVTRFWMQVERGGDGECWPWKGYAEKGYGRVFHLGRMVGAHELAVTFTTGEVRLPSLDTRHSCDNPICCNPGHLCFGTRQENVDDMFSRGRELRGEKSPKAKLSNAVVQEIRERRANGALQKDLAIQYQISDAYVSDIVNGLVWQEAGGPITGRSKRTKRYANSRQGKAD